MPHKNNIHIGNLIRKKLHEQGRTVIWLATQMSCERTKIHRIFNSKDLYSDVIFTVSKILDYDFFSHFSDTLNNEK